MATAAAIKQALEVLDGAQYVKQWDTSGECIVLREAWLDDAGELVRTREHNFLADQPKAPEPEPAASGDVTLTLEGVQAEGQAGEVKA